MTEEKNKEPIHLNPMEELWICTDCPYKKKCEKTDKDCLKYTFGE